MAIGFGVNTDYYHLKKGAYKIALEKNPRVRKHFQDNLEYLKADYPDATEEELFEDFLVAIYQPELESNDNSIFTIIAEAINETCFPEESKFIGPVMTYEGRFYVSPYIPKTKDDVPYTIESITEIFRNWLGLIVENQIDPDWMSFYEEDC